MIKYLGLLLFIPIFSASAGTSTVLMLRAVVPVKTEVKVTLTKDGPQTRIHSNSRSPASLPRVKYEQNGSYYLVSITAN